jgi:hypothetical protein
MKLKQICVLKDIRDPEIAYVCAPCSTATDDQDLLVIIMWRKIHYGYGGLVELVVNAMVDIESLIEWDQRLIVIFKDLLQNIRELSSQMAPWMEAYPDTSKFMRQ